MKLGVPLKRVVGGEDHTMLLQRASATTKHNILGTIGSRAKA